MKAKTNSFLNWLFADKLASDPSDTGLIQRLVILYCGVAVLALLVSAVVDIHSPFPVIGYVDLGLAILCLALIWVSYKGYPRVTIFIFSLGINSVLVLYHIHYGHDSGNVVFYIALLIVQLTFLIRNFFWDIILVFLITLIVLCLDVILIGDVIEVKANDELGESVFRFNVLLGAVVILSLSVGMVFQIRHVLRKLEEELQVKEVVHAELNHRVRNNMNVVLSLLNLQARSTTSAEAREELEQMRARIYAMASVHNHAYGLDSWNAISLKKYVEDIMGSQGVAVDDLGDWYKGSTGVMLTASQAIPLGIVVSELLHSHLRALGFGKPPQYNVEVEENGQQLKFSISSSTPLSSSIPLLNTGRDVVEGLCAQLDGKFNLELDQNLSFELDFPLKPVAQ